MEPVLVLAEPVLAAAAPTPGVAEPLEEVMRLWPHRTKGL